MAHQSTAENQDVAKLREEVNMLLAKDFHFIKGIFDYTRFNVS